MLLESNFETKSVSKIFRNKCTANPVKIWQMRHVEKRSSVRGTLDREAELCEGHVGQRSGAL